MLYVKVLLTVNLEQSLEFRKADQASGVTFYDMQVPSKDKAVCDTHTHVLINSSQMAQSPSIERSSLKS